MQTGWLGKLLGGAVAVIVAAPACQAVILFGLDNSANRTDPGSGSPFSTVALVADAGKANPSGSAVHLGGGYMLTANHVGMRPYVTFDGSTFYQRDLSFSPVQVAASVDMQVFRLTTTPTVGSASLYGGFGEQIAPALLVGWGVGRNPTVPVDSASRRSVSDPTPDLDVTSRARSTSDSRSASVCVTGLAMPPPYRYGVT